VSAAPSRGFWPLRDLPVVGWLLAVVVVALAHPFVPVPRWLMIHLLLLGAITHAILVWSRYFADALLHTAPGPDDRRVQGRRLLLLNAGVLTVVTGVLGGAWSVTLTGASAVAAAVIWHGLALVRQLRRALPSRFGVTVRYYVAAACLLPVGAGLGATLARDPSGPWHDRLVLAHAFVNVLGWMGLTVVGTLVTLWPTMLRTRIADGAEQAAGRALPVLVASILLAAGAALAGSAPAVALGLVGYLGGLAVVARPSLAATRGAVSWSYATWSVLAAMLWLGGALAALAVGVITSPTWAEAAGWFGWLSPYLAGGFGAQVLIGALSYLVPVALGGGPGPVRAATAVLERGSPLRIAVINAGLLVCVLPVPSAVRVPASVLVLAGLASFLALVFPAIRASRRAKRAPVTEPVVWRAADRPRGQVTGLAAVGVAAVVLAVAAGAAFDPTTLVAAAASSPATSQPPAVTPTGETTTVAVTARDMRFTPATIEVPAGNRLVIDVTNADPANVHDLVLETGHHSGRLAPGESARIDVGVVGHDLTGWCSIVGHRQMGMVLQITATGAPTPPGTREPAPEAQRVDLAADPGSTAHDPTLPPAPEERVHRHTFTVEEVVREVSPGVTRTLWTFNGTAPGPVLHGRVGDVFEITLVNNASIGHSIDFHAGALAPDGPMRTIAPGESLVYRFTATRAGIWMYHCSSMPMSAHIAAGLFGAVVIDPPDLASADRSYVLVQSELYPGAEGEPVDMGKVQAERPDAVVFNGHPNQYDHRPLPARPGERVRIWVLNAGPNRATSFHVVGAQFDTTYKEGGYLLTPGHGGSQSLDLAPAQGGFVELTFPEPGHYPFVSHVMVDAERGAHGVVEVTG
jgi:nitrite reductase (NO-forming)